MVNVRFTGRLSGTMRLLALSVLVALAAVAAHGQNVTATARVDSNHILIGDWLKLTIEINHPSDISVSRPALPDSLEGFEIVRRDSPVVKTSGGQSLTTAGFVITSFDTGMHIFPAVPVRYLRQGDTTKYYAETSPVLVTVRGIAVDTSLDIKDIKPPMGVPITFADILPYLIGIIVLGGIVWLVRYIMKKRARGESLIPEEPPRPAHEIALEALRALESEKLWQRGKVKEYHSQLTDIIRVYIGRRFRIMAMEMVSDEILGSPPIRALPGEAAGRLRDLLFCADLVKFAKYQPAAGKNEKSMESSYAFVEQTWRDHEPAPAAEQVQQPAGEVKVS